MALSVFPTRQIGAFRSGFFNSFQYFRQIECVVAQTGNGIGIGMVAIPAMFRPVAVIDFTLIRRLRLFEEILREIDRIVQVVIIHVADIDMDLALKFGAERFPVAFHDVTQVVILTPIFGDGRIDLAGALVPRYEP